MISSPIIYDSVLSTGTVSVSGCSSSDLGTNTSDVLNKTPAGAKDRFFFQKSFGHRGTRNSTFCRWSNLVPRSAVNGAGDK